MNNSGRVPAKNDEWPQEPDGFYNIKFGSTKEDAEKVVTFEEYTVSEDGYGPGLDTPYPTRGITHFSFGGVEITACLIFTPVDGCHCFEGIFPTEQFDNIKSEFLSLYGQPHEVSSGVRQFDEVDWTTPPFHTLHEANVELLKWCSERVYIFLISQEQYSKGHFLVASYFYMKNRSGGGKMREKAERKLAPCTQDEYKPPGGWTQEPDDFNGLKLGMTKAEAERHVTLGKCTVTKHDFPDIPNPELFVYVTTLHLAGLAIPGEILFIEDRLINVGGKFDKSHWEAVKSAFILLCGRPHCDRREEMIVDRGALEVALHQRLDWHGERVWIDCWTPQMEPTSGASTSNKVPRLAVTANRRLR